ncbi:MAG TPA: flavin reductase family protein [Thermoanaerobaculaceae bacterium]|nr:flavin reductase family protein [Thermoanaerobaculaceae bacterium]
MSGEGVAGAGSATAGSEVVTLDAAATAWQEVYRRIVEVVVPRPIALVSTVDAEGRANLAPFSFFTVVSSNPPCLAFAPLRSGRTGELKDTLLNVEATREFVVAAVTEELAAKVNSTAAQLPHGVSEFAHAGLTPAKSRRVAPPMVAESPVNIECRLVEVRTYGAGPGAGSLVVGEILAVHLHTALLDERGRVVADRLHAVGRMGGELWVRTRETFEMSRPD